MDYTAESVNFVNVPHCAAEKLFEPQNGAGIHIHYMNRIIAVFMDRLCLCRFSPLIMEDLFIII